MPDFDVDFCMDKRDQVIDHVAEMYGRDAVSQIITFGTMAAKAGGSNLSHFAAYRNSFYAGVVIRHFVAKTTHFLLIEKNRKCVDLVQLNNATLSQAAQAAELLFEV